MYAWFSERLRKLRKDATHHLPCGHADGLDRKLAAAHVEQVLQVGAEQVNNKHIVQTFLAEVMNLRDTR